MVNVKNIIKILVIVTFATLTICLAQFHEPWSDEAQSFLIARDTTILDVFHYMKYEGTPPLWVLTIKLFLLIGGTYEFLYIVPIICSIVGVVIFEFKVKAPMYIKIIFPFTYFILYQNTIIRRSYSLIFPVLMMIAAMYEKRFEKPFLYSLLLLLLMNISLHTLVISGSLYLIFLIEMVMKKEYKNTNVILADILIFFELGIAALMTYPASDCTFSGNGGRPFYYVLSEATISSNFGINGEAAITCVLALVVAYLFKKDNSVYTIFEFCALFVPVMMVFCLITYQGWHIGIVWLLILTYFIIKDKLYEDDIIKKFVMIICIFQMFWSIDSYTYDFTNNYSGSKAVANFIKEIDNYEDLEIYGWGYSITAIQPYFEENIFDNVLVDKAFWHWNSEKNILDYDEFWENQADVYVISDFYMSRNLAVSWINLDEYEEHCFEGNIYMKDHIYENEGYHVYVKK